MKNIKAFIEKWNVGYEDPGQQAEFAREMRRDIDSLITQKCLKEKYHPNNDRDWSAKTENLFNKYTVNGMREMTFQRFKEAAAELSRDKLTPHHHTTTK